MNSREFLYCYKRLSKERKCELTMEEAAKDIEIMVESIFESLMKDSELKLKNKGKFVVLNKKKRIIKNIHTGEKMEIPPKKVVKFVQSKKLELTEYTPENKK